jgi:hypothetical protein
MRSRYPSDTPTERVDAIRERIDVQRERIETVRAGVDEPEDPRAGTAGGSARFLL